MAAEETVDLVFAELAVLIPIFPFLGFLFILFFGRYFQEEGKGIARKLWKEEGGNFAVLFVAISWLLSLLVGGEVFYHLYWEKEHAVEVYKEITWEWFKVGDFVVSYGAYIDPVSAFALIVISTLCLIILVYSLGYMHEEIGKSRYYAEFSLFVMGVLGLVIAPNFIMLFLFWEYTGLCSYLLIGFYIRKAGEMKPDPEWASKKAFLTTKIGDVALMIGFIMLYLELKDLGHGTMNFLQLIKHWDEWSESIPESKIVLMGILIFGGAIGKSAQFPLHVWLPDAMAGPTTVSALIHSAAMVKVGIYLIARCYWFYDIPKAEDALLFIAVIGGITAVMSATIALVNTDIKGILAYSTISQLAYMVIGLGVGGMGVAMFHLMNHAVFKALLFLSAGSVIHAMHTNDIREMGGLREPMPITWKVMLVGCLGLSGIIPFNGFFSKDAIILNAYLQAEYTGDILSWLVWGSAVFTALLTAFYTFRMFFLVFMGDMRDEHAHPHESPPIMTIPLIILAALVIILGLIALPGFVSNFFGDFWSLESYLHEWLQGHGEGENGDYVKFLGFDVHKSMAVFSLILATLGIFVAYLFYLPPKGSTIEFPEDGNISITYASGSIHSTVKGMAFGIVSVPPFSWYQKVLENGYYFDALYEDLIVKRIIYEGIAVGMVIVEGIIDWIVNAFGRGTVILCTASRWFDDHIIDGVINGIAQVTMFCGRYLRRIHTGLIENYANYALLGLLILMLVAFLESGLF